MRYSPSTKAFYPEHIDYPQLPGDLVQVDDELHAEYMRAPSGTRVSVSANGRASLVPPEEPGLDTLKTEKVWKLRFDRENIAQQLNFTTAAGVQTTFGNTPEDQKNAEATLALGEKAWKSIGLYLDARGSVVTPFTFEDLKGLSRAMEDNKPISHAELLKRIAAVLSAKTAEALEAL